MANEGVKLDQGKLPYHLLAPEGLEGVVKVLQFGAQKYADRNWEKGMAWSRCFAPLMRHMWAWWSGQSTDPETGYSHLHHAACCIHFLQTYEARGIGMDDRPKTKKPADDGWQDCGRNVNSPDGEPRRNEKPINPIKTGPIGGGIVAGNEFVDQTLLADFREALRDTYDSYASVPDATGHS